MLMMTAGVSAESWDGTVADSYDGGDGSKGSPYLIASASQLAKLSADIEADPAFSRGKYFRLTDDIVFNDSLYENMKTTSTQDVPKTGVTFIKVPMIGSFTSDTEYTAFEGEFDGDGHVIRGVYLEENIPYCALFRIVENAVIKNLGLESSYYYCNASVGGIAGRVINSRMVNCYVAQCFIEGAGSYIGALCGQCLGSSQVLNCYTAATVYGKNNESGIIGRVGNGQTNNVLVENCYSYTEVKIKRRNGGGISVETCDGSTVRNCYYALLGEVMYGIWPDYEQSTTVNMRKLSDSQFMDESFVDTLNANAASIPLACRWKKGETTPVFDFSTINADDDQYGPAGVIELSSDGNEQPKDGYKVYNIHGFLIGEYPSLSDVVLPRGIYIVKGSGNSRVVLK